jgi:hypothetical protein
VAVNELGTPIEKLRITAIKENGAGWLEAEIFRDGQWAEKLYVDNPSGMARTDTGLADHRQEAERRRAARARGAARHP